MKKIYIGMSADIFHHGHINIISEARKYGEVIIGLMSDKIVSDYKRIPYLNWENRKKIIENAISIALDTKTLEKVLTINYQRFQFLKKESSKRHEIFIFSNFLKRAFEVVNRKYPQLFILIPKGDIILSSHEKSIKPKQ